jgi:hypothetical protein
MGEEAILNVLSGSGAGVVVAVYFLNRFMAFQKDVTDKLISEMKEDRKSWEDTVKKIDTRLTYLETLIEHFCKEK